jgi:hypothetical protein
LVELEGEYYKYNSREKLLEDIKTDNLKRKAKPRKYQITWFSIIEAQDSPEIHNKFMESRFQNTLSIKSHSYYFDGKKLNEEGSQELEVPLTTAFKSSLRDILKKS